MTNETDTAGLGRNLTYGLVEELGRAIVAGAYATHPFPTEAELTARSGVSRSVTREAVKILTTKGLLGARPKQGTFVQPETAWSLFDGDILRWMLDRKPSAQLVRQFNELRLGVEPQAAALAARTGDAAAIARIGEGLERMRRAEAQEDDPLASDLAFHVAILEACGNPFFLQFKPLISTALRASIRYTNRLAGRSANVAEHESIYRAIKASNSTKAANAMHKLISDALDLLSGSQNLQRNGAGATHT